MVPVTILICKWGQYNYNSDFWILFQIIWTKYALLQVVLVAWPLWKSLEAHRGHCFEQSGLKNPIFMTFCQDDYI